MSTATKEKPKTSKRTKPSVSEIDQLKSELESARAELKNVEVFFGEVQKFSDLVTNAKVELKKQLSREFDLKEELSEVRAEMRSLKNLIESANDGMLAVLEPGPKDFMPLFDQMEKPDPDMHGENAGQWREKPVALLRLSPLAANKLVDAGIVFIGQLQDLILADPDEWWKEATDLTDAVAAAIADKLNDFIAKGGKH